jgi:CRISPR system Cascade subunit CasA
MSFEFNLIDQPWIPVLDSSGIPREVSLSDVLINAQRYLQLSASFPQTNAALYRLLLAVLHRNFGPKNDDEWQQLWLAQQFNRQALEGYFAQWYPRFDLFAPDRPFMQARQPKTEPKPANALLFLVAGGDPDTLYNHNLDSVPIILTPQQAAQALITAHSFGIAGLCHPQLKLVYTDAPCARGAVFFLQGRNLFESLMLNLVRYTPAEPIPFHGDEPDRPAWEMDDPYMPDRSVPFGYLDYLTWQNRCIMLFPSEVDGKTVVQKVTTSSGLAINAELSNPMHHYRIDEKTGRKILRFTEGRALWRDSSVLLNLKSGNFNPQAICWAEELIAYGYLPAQKLKLAAYGMSTAPGKQKVHFYRGEQFEFSNELLTRQDLIDTLDYALELAHELRNQLWGAMRRLAQLILSSEADLQNGRTPDPNDIENLIVHWEGESQYWSRLEVPFMHFLDLLPADQEQALEEWRKSIRSAVLNAFNYTTQQSGSQPKALKAAAIARVQMLSGIKKVLVPQTQEENNAIHA